MNILITGCAGYIGSKLLDVILRKFKGCKVVGIDNLMYDQSFLIPYLEREFDFTFYKYDLSNSHYAPHIRKAIEKSDLILPLAALVGMPLCDKNPILAYRLNHQSIEDILKLAPDAKVIFPTTNSGYGVGEEDDQGNLKYCTEETPLNPLSHYGKSKVLAEKAVLEHGGISLRLATVHGLSPRMRLDLLVNDFTDKAMVNGMLELYEPHFKRNYIHIDDVIDAFLFCIGNYEAMQGEVYNVGSEENLSKQELSEKIKLIINEELGWNTDITVKKGSDPDKRNYIVSNKKLHEAGFKPIFTVEDSIRDIIRVHPYLLKCNLFCKMRNV